MLKEAGFWFGVAAFFTAALLWCFVCGGCVGMMIGARWWKSVESKPEEPEDIVYICSSRPSCYHMVAVNGGVSMKPLKQCDHCSKAKKKNNGSALLCRHIGCRHIGWSKNVKV
jgi:hypothetical protein